jgi:flagellar hook-length control protein FliK
LASGQTANRGFSWAQSDNAPSAPAERAGQGRDAGVAFAGDASVAIAAPTSPSDISAVALSGLSSRGLPEDLSKQVMGMITSDGGEAVLRLHPPELGELTVRVMVEGRNVSAWFDSPQPQVQQAVSQALGQLRSDLGGAGYNLSGAWVGADASGQRRRSADAPPTAGPSVMAPAAAEQPGMTEPIVSSSRVSIYV